MKTVHVAAGIIRKEGSDELLAVQRGYGDMQGLWEFPGGKLMRGETPEDAVRRELMEELQVKVTNLRDFYTVEYDYPDFHLSMECYYCSLADESDEPQKHDRQLDIRWIPRASLATVEWMPADKGLIDALIELKEDRLEANAASRRRGHHGRRICYQTQARSLSAAAKSVPSPAYSTASIPRTSPLTSANWCAVAPPSKSP